jgi:hypothetical protein
MLRKFFQTVLAQNPLSTLLKYNVGACVIIFVLLQLWRPYYFLTNDSLAGDYPVLVEMGRHMQHGESPFISNYMFGGHYDWSRDLGCLCWHPFYLLPAMLADTHEQLGMVDIISLLYLLVTTVGFTLLVYKLRKDFVLNLPDISLIFYTMSFVFSMYILSVGASWLGFLGNQSALPWLTLGILDRKLIHGVILVALVTVHQFVGSYAGMTISNSLFLTFFAAGMAVGERSFRPIFTWCTGNLMGYLIISPFLLRVLDGFSHAYRIIGFHAEALTEFNEPASIVPFSFFCGNWTEPLAKLQGDTTLTSLPIPYLSGLFACAAAWCLVPALVGSARWRPMEILCLMIAGFILLWIIRPYALAVALQHVPLLRSLRWPFREILQFTFFIHLLIILRPSFENRRLRWLVPLLSLAMFLLPLPFIRPPTLDPLLADRKAVISGDGDLFWNRVRPLLKSTDQTATVIDWQTWNAYRPEIPYSYLGTAAFPSLYRVHCLSGYSTTSPIDQVPLTTKPSFWFGAFDPTQVNTILHERPDLKLIILERMHPMRIILRSENSPDVDLTPYLPQ